ncbi:MAG: hypothetical protein DCC46_11080, partial [Armatimonadetes bacterium]
MPWTTQRPMMPRLEPKSSCLRKTSLAGIRVSTGLPPRIEDVRKVVLWFKLEAIMKRSKFTEEQIVRILQEAASGQKTQ